MGKDYFFEQPKVPHVAPGVDAPLHQRLESREQEKREKFVAMAECRLLREDFENCMRRERESASYKCAEYHRRWAERHAMPFCGALKSPPEMPPLEEEYLPDWYKQKQADKKKLEESRYWGQPVQQD
eukprot:TRINITY_DN5913_c0_g1::TRINITY_DN5913_c0_g1_i1::g.9943::m.9943 TRINITY_DN5913_c0_g1::TRINITY_DN5913_c0_g1_i1::g.9943  ORF type:complete len:141 (+),score=13.86,NDUFB10/PF10249.4/0.00044 TRINITY_DN5913_c0_g1_i1:45-425(+)